LNIFYAFWNRSEINHITGDISYITPFLLGRKNIITFHDIESLARKSFLRNLLLKYFWVILPSKNASVITVISEHTKSKIIQTVKGIDPGKIKVIYNPISTELKLIPKSFNCVKPVILAVGTKPNKNLENIIRAVIGIKCTLLVVGRMSELQLSMLREHSIEYENIYNVPYEKIIEAYARCDILCFPSLYEGFGLPIIEAQTIGRPVITSNYGAMKEIGGEGAILVNPLDVLGISEALKKLFIDEKLRESLVEKGRKNILRFDAQKIADQYLNIYHKLL